jgi:hypothetical protein
MSTSLLPQGQGFKTPLMSLPEEPIFMPYSFDFTKDAAQIVTKDFVQEMQALKIPFVQSIYIDNSGDANPMTLAFNDGTFSITVKGRTQGFYPLCVAEGPLRVTATSTGAAIAKTVIFLSMMVPPINWATA